MCPRTPRYPFLNWYPHFLDQRYAPGQLSYPAVAAASMKINSTLPSSAAVERVFSVAAQVLTARHCHMSDTLEQVTSAHLPWVTLTVAESGDDDKGSTNADSLYLMYLLYCHINYIICITYASGQLVLLLLLKIRLDCNKAACDYNVYVQNLKHYEYKIYYSLPKAKITLYNVSSKV